MLSNKKRNEYELELNELNALNARRKIEYERGKNKIEARRKKLRKLLSTTSTTSEQEEAA